MAPDKYPQRHARNDRRRMIISACSDAPSEPRPYSAEWEAQRSAFDEALAFKGPEILDDVRTFISRFCVFPDSRVLAAVTLWVGHAHMIKHFHTTPRLVLSSPEAGSGKTRVLEVLELLVPEPLLSISASPAAVFRTLSQRQVTLLFDEVDSIWSGRGKDDNHEDLRALLNAGYKRGAKIPRCVGPKHEVQMFPVYAAVALAGIGDLPDTIMTRSVIIRMRRRAPCEPVEPFRSRQHDGAGHEVRDALAAWAERVGPSTGASWPKLPDGIVDRPAEIWEPLISVADAAGGHWPTTAREACVSLCKAALDRRATLGVRLLRDLRTIFRDHTALHTEKILADLHRGEDAGLEPDAPWADLHGKPINVRQLASMLKPYNVASLKVTVLGRSLQGYRREHLWDPWQRYLPPESAPPECLEFSESDSGQPSTGSSGSSTNSGNSDHGGSRVGIRNIAPLRDDLERLE